MRKHSSSSIQARFTILFLGLLGLVAPQTAAAESVMERGLFNVSINLAGSIGSGISGSDSASSWSTQDVPQAAVTGSTQLPDSLHFAGLAGALNLVIDKSTGTPLVDGIALAPRETLRFIANDHGGIGGLLGQVSIRLDF